MKNHRLKSSTRGGGFCLCSRGFNRRVIGNHRVIENHRVKSSTRGGGFCLCSRGFNRRDWFTAQWNHNDYIPIEAPAIGNRGYTNDVRLRGRRGYSEIRPRRL